MLNSIKKDSESNNNESHILSRKDRKTDKKIAGNSSKITIESC